MRLLGIGMTIEGADGAKSPPLPFVEVDDAEGAVLLALYPKLLRQVDDARVDDPERDRLAAEWAACEAAARDAAQAEEAERKRVAAEEAEADAKRIADETEAKRVADMLAAEEAAAAAAAAGGSGNTGDTDGVAKRATEIGDAIDLLGDDDKVKTGDRAGKPKVKAVVDILGYETTAEEIDAVIAARDAE